MARTKRSANLSSRSARLKLIKEKRHYDPLAPGLSLYYRRPKDGAAGSWGICYGDGQKHKGIGTADDYADADGITFLNFQQAQAKAQELFQCEIRRAKTIESGKELIDTDSFTVADALAAYFKDKERPNATGAKGIKIYKQVVNAWIIEAIGNNPPLGDVPLSKLTKQRINDWHDSIANSGRRTGGKIGLPPQNAEAKRKRSDTANRVLRILKAALNFVVNENDEDFKNLNPCWNRAKEYSNVARPRDRVLDIEEQVKLVHACPPDFRDLVRGLLLTGCRYGELCKLRCKDYKPSKKIDGIFKGAIHIAQSHSKTDIPRDVQLTADGAKLFDRLTKGRSHNANIFTHTATRHERTEEGIKKIIITDDAWKNSDQDELIETACINAGIDKVVLYDLRHTYATMLFEAECDLHTVAKQMGTSIKMLERFYVKVREKHVAASINQAYPKTGILDDPEEATIVQFRPKTG